MNTHLNTLQVSALFLIFCFLYTIIIATLFSIQILHYEFYRTRATRQYALTLTQHPPRAPILDRTGNHYLAMNKDSTAAFVLPHAIEDTKTLYTFLDNHFPKAAERLRTNTDKKFLYVKRKLTDQEIALIQNSGSNDIHLLKEPSRFYPVSAASCIIGITNIDNQGLFGIEHTYNTLLAGTPTTVCLEKDARSGLYCFEKNTTVIGCNGTPLHLTLDADLQFLAQQELQKSITQFNAREGAALIMNPDNGHILAMVNVPSFDPHNTKQLDMDTVKVRCITEQYELGSVFKVFAALAAFEEGIVTPDEIIDCKNSKTAIIHGRRVNTVHAHGSIPFCDVVALSNNIGIATVAHQLDEAIYDHYLKLGFGKKTGIELEGEATGFVNGPYNWSKQSIISLSYGYEVTATLLQLACAFAIIARNGYAIKPTIFMASSTANQTPQLYKQETIDTIKDILKRTTHYGTAKRAQIKGYTVMTKTGTANMLEDGVYNQQRNRYTCAGIVEKGEYKRVIVVFIQEAEKPNLYAATVVAPLFEKIAEHMLIHERVI